MFYLQMVEGSEDEILGKFSSYYVRNRKTGT